MTTPAPLTGLRREIADLVERARYWDEQHNEDMYALTHARINDKLDRILQYQTAPTAPR